MGVTRRFYVPGIRFSGSVALQIINEELLVLCQTIARRVVGTRASLLIIEYFVRS